MELTRARQRARPEYLRATLYAAVLLWVNLYIAHDFFSTHTAHMNSMHGFWIALAKRASGGWFRPSWWPYWDCGIPFEATYAPLIPAMTAAWAALASIPHSQAFSAVSGFFYCLAPMTLFLMAWLLTRAPGASFIAAMFYSLASVTELILPDGEFRLGRIWDARRMFLVSVWDDTPHMAAVSLLPLAILFLVYAIERRRAVWCAVAAATIALMTVASAFGPVLAAMAAACLLFVLRRESWAGNTLRVAAIGSYAYLDGHGVRPALHIPSHSRIGRREWHRTLEPGIAHHPRLADSGMDRNVAFPAALDRGLAHSLLFALYLGHSVRAPERPVLSPPSAAAGGSLQNGTGAGALRVPGPRRGGRCMPNSPSPYGARSPFSSCWRWRRSRW